MDGELFLLLGKGASTNFRTELQHRAIPNPHKLRLSVSRPPWGSWECEVLEGENRKLFSNFNFRF